VAKNTQVTEKALVIVESPAKAKTINRYLGAKFKVMASMGHIRDLPPNELGIDLERNFEPVYQVLGEKRRYVTGLKKAADNANTVYLATDLDREGEAIAWHLIYALDLEPAHARRVVFNEITKSAIQAAFAAPHDVDMDKVNAQQARRLLDRIVGYQLSPLIQAKIGKGLSAGRVQSVAVRLTVEREEEIRAFVPEESWRVFACFSTDRSKASKDATSWAKFLAGGKHPRTARSASERNAWLSKHQCLYTELVKLDGKDFKADTVTDLSRTRTRVSRRSSCAGTRSPQRRRRSPSKTSRNVARRRSPALHSRRPVSSRQPRALWGSHRRAPCASHNSFTKASIWVERRVPSG
jgi:DNA topoisomerase-1